MFNEKIDSTGQGFF